jgi:hypothetical protein
MLVISAALSYQRRWWARRKSIESGRSCCMATSQPPALSIMRTARRIAAEEMAAWRGVWEEGMERQKWLKAEKRDRSTSLSYRLRHRYCCVA